MLDNLRDLAPEPAAPWSDYAVQGRVPELVLQPTDREQAAAVLAAAHAHRLAVVPWGGGTQQDFGYAPERVDVVLDLSRLRRVIEYEPADLTATVEVGCTLAELQAVLAEHNQYLPLDPPQPERATIGGLLATNTNGPLRYGHGAWRDRLLGLRVLRADGTLIKGGGKVVKNVAGLDLPKLFIGSLGTLGVIVEATFKLHPRPPAERLLRLVLPSLAAAEDVLAALMETALLPSLIELRKGGKGREGEGRGRRGREEERRGEKRREGEGEVKRETPAASQSLPSPSVPFRPLPSPSVPSADWELFIGFDGPEETVAWEVDELRRVLANCRERTPCRSSAEIEVTEVGNGRRAVPVGNGRRAVPSEEQAAVRRELADFPAALAPAAGRVSLRASVLSSAVAGFCQAVLDQAGRVGADAAIQAEAGNGIVHIHLDWDESAIRNPQIGESANNANRREFPALVRGNSRRLADRNPQSAIRNPQAEVVQQLCEAAVAGQGNLIVTAAPPELKSDLPVWGAPRDDFVLMQRVKEQMDPNRLLNPGRFVGGL